MPDEEDYEEEYEEEGEEPQEEEGEEEYEEESPEEDLGEIIDDLEEYQGDVEQFDEIPDQYTDEQYAVSEPYESYEEEQPTYEREEVQRPAEIMKFDESLEQLPKVGPLYGRLVDIVLLLIAVIMVLYFLAFGLYSDVNKIQTLEMGVLLNIGLWGLGGVVMLYLLASNNINKGDALCRLDTIEGYKAAAEKYEAALKIDKRSKKAWTCKGIALRMMSHDDRNLKEALMCHNMALKLDPKYGVAWVNKGNVLFNMGMSDEALKCYDKAIDLDPNYTVAWVNKGEMLVKLGQRVEAQKCLDRARSIAE